MFESPFNAILLYIIFRMSEVLMRQVPNAGTITPDGFTREMEFVKKTLAVLIVITCVLIMYNVNRTGFPVR